MKCTTCNAEVNPDSTFCHKCGERIDRSQRDDAPSAPEINEAPVEDADGDAPDDDSPVERIRNAVSRNVADDVEEEKWQGRYSGKAMIGNWLLGGLATIGLLVLAVVIQQWMWAVAGIGIVVVWLGLLLLMLYRKMNVRYELTTQRFIHISGILSQTTDRIEAIDMDDVTFRQNLFERMVGVGTIKILSSDVSHPELVLRGIDNVKQTADLIDNVRRRERRRRGLHIESV